MVMEQYLWLSLKRCHWIFHIHFANNIFGLKVMKRSGKITDAHINEMMKKGDLDGDG